jgi:hypothetical protein
LEGSSSHPNPIAGAEHSQTDSNDSNRASESELDNIPQESLDREIELRLAAAEKASTPNFAAFSFMTLYNERSARLGGPPLALVGSLHDRVRRLNDIITLLEEKWGQTHGIDDESRNIESTSAHTLAVLKQQSNNAKSYAEIDDRVSNTVWNIMNSTHASPAQIENTFQKLTRCMADVIVPRDLSSDLKYVTFLLYPMNIINIDH